MKSKLENAQFYLDINKKQTAFLLYKEIINENPNIPDAWFGLALCLDDFEKKEYCLIRAIQLKPNYDAALKELQVANSKRKILKNSTNNEILMNNQSDKKTSISSKPNIIENEPNSFKPYHYREIKFNPSLNIDGSETPRNQPKIRKANLVLILLGVLFIVGICVISTTFYYLLRSPSKSTTTFNKSRTPTTSSMSPSSSYYVIGTWYSTWAVPRTITIFKSGSSYYMESVFSDGSGSTIFLDYYDVNGERRFIHYPETRYGDYLVIESDGSLGFYDNEGYIYSVSP